jgi:hypothetical protein
METRRLQLYQNLGTYETQFIEKPDIPKDVIDLSRLRIPKRFSNNLITEDTENFRKLEQKLKHLDRMDHFPER